MRSDQRVPRFNLGPQSQGQPLAKKLGIKPGSTLFLVWNEGRQGFNNLEGTKDFNGDVRDLFSLHPANTFLVKVSYWLNR